MIHSESGFHAKMIFRLARRSSCETVKGRCPPPGGNSCGSAHNTPDGSECDPSGAAFRRRSFDAGDLRRDGIAAIGHGNRQVGGFVARGCNGHGIGRGANGGIAAQAAAVEHEQRAGAAEIIGIRVVGIARGPGIGRVADGDPGDCPDPGHRLGLIGAVTVGIDLSPPESGYD